MNISQYQWTIKTLRQSYKVKKISNFPASAMTAQAILESSYGRKTPRDIHSNKDSFNLFGIKGMGENGCVECWTREWDAKAKEYVLVKAHFRAYFNYEGSFNDYVKLISSTPRYKEALNYLDSPKQFVYELWKAGWATDWSYLEKVYKLIDQVNRIPVVLVK